MANDVIITPATGLVEFKDNTVLKGSIYESAGDIVINPVTGSVVLGDGTPANILAGGVGVPVNITLQGGGNLSSNTNTLGIGVNGDTVNFTVAGVTYNWPTTLMRTADYTATDILTRLKTVDGLGSGLDADLLDGYGVGTSGSTIPLLNTANTWSATQTIPTVVGNLTGNVTGTLSNTSTGTNSVTLLSATMADNDNFRLLVGGTATNAGFVEIATADDGTEPIHVRQYTGGFSALVRTATILDSAGNTVFPGSVNAGLNYFGTGATFTSASGAGFGQIKVKGTTGTTGYGLIHRHDGSDYYILVTANNDADGSWTTARPFSINLATGNTNLGVTTAASLVVTGDLTVNGTTSTINSTTLTVDDKNLELGSVATPTDATADGGGITLKGATDKTFNWVSATGYWTSNQSISAPRLISTVAQGTAPLIVTSTTLVTNLNADLLDGLNSASTNTASTIVARDASGNFAAGTITATLTGSASSVASQGTVTALTTTADAPAGITMQQAYSNGYPTTYGNVISLGGAGHNQIFFGWSGVSGASADNYIRSQRDTGDANWSAWAKIWTDVNDGTGSGLDADLLDGNDSTYFTNATNLASGTVPAARMPAHTGDVTSSVGAVALTLATVNSNVGSFGSASAIPVLTVNAKGLITAVSTATVSSLPTQTGNAGKYLTTDGTTAAWADISSSIQTAATDAAIVMAIALG
jgi:hypothetical protein